jgi:peptide/nickel transport system permease protein
VPGVSVLAAVGRRAVVALVTLFVASLLLFAAERELPADPAALTLPAGAKPAEIAKARQELGLDRALVVQYAIWLGDAARLDFGQSARLHRPVAPLLASALPATIALALCGLAAGALLGLSGGLALFAAHDDAVRSVAEAWVTALGAVPAFLWAPLLIVAGWAAPSALDPGDIAALGLPTAALALAAAPALALALSTALRETAAAEHIRQARLRGLGETRILLRHMLPASVATALADLRFNRFLGAVLLVEAISGYRGVGTLLAEAIGHADLALVQAAGLGCCVVVLAADILADGLRAAVDPRAAPR